MARTANPSLREERRKSILHAAELIFSQQGFAQSTISEIAKSAGVSHATVFQYFRNKEELFRSVIIENIERAHVFYKELLLGPGDPVERLQSLVSKQIRIALQSSAYLRLVQHILGQPQRFPEFVVQLDQFAEDFMQLVVRVVQEGQQRKLLDEGDPYEMARSYFAYWNGVGMCIRNMDENTIQQLTVNGLKLFGL
jgi:AcrR family transcriptional regulator